MTSADNQTPAADWFTPVALTGPTLRLSPLQPSDAAGYLAALGDPDAAAEVTRHLRHPVPRDEAAARAIIEDAVGTPGRMPYAQRLLATGELVGTTSFYDIDPALRTVAIGHTWIGRRWWRTGVNSESKLLMLTRAFDGLGAERVVWHTDIRNERSQAAIARLGATREGVLRHHRIRADGSWRDTVQFSLLSEEWPATRALLTAGLDRPVGEQAQDPGARDVSAAGAEPAATTAEEVQLAHSAERSRYEARLAGEVVGVVDYRRDGPTVVVTHTGTDPALRGRGIAGRLTRFALDDLRARGDRLRPVCPYTVGYVEQHPEYADLLAPGR